MMTYSERKDLHDRLRQKAWEAYVRIPLDDIYYNSRGSLEFTWQEAGEQGEQRKLHVDPMASAAIVNALVPKSGVLYRGGHGGGKTILMEKVGHMLTGIPERELNEAIIRGNNSHNYQSTVATPHLGKLIRDGDTSDVRWSRFVTSYFKGIDEINRFPPDVQNYFLDLLNRGRAQDIVSQQVLELDDYVFFATENPDDPGTYPLSRPLLDRFGICIPAPQLPSIVDQDLLADRYDDKLRAVRARPVMGLDELRTARRIISEDVKLSDMAAIYATYLTQWLSTCTRADFASKDHNAIEVGERCKDCPIEPQQICSATQRGVSGRAFYDFVRWGKAYAWFLGLLETERDTGSGKAPIEPEVPQHVIEALAPFLLYHRLEPAPRYFAREPYYGQPLEYTRMLITRIDTAFAGCQGLIREEFPRILNGSLPYAESQLSMYPDKDLVMSQFFKPLSQEASRKEFRTLYDRINAIPPAETGRMTAEERAAHVQGVLQRRTSLAQDILLRNGGLKPIAQMFLLSKAKDRLGIPPQNEIYPGLPGAVALDQGAA
jgi:MoxR-like ATPase